MTFASFWCLLMGGGAYRVVARDYVPPPTAAEAAVQAAEDQAQGIRPRPPRTGYFKTYKALCKRCGQDIATHL